MTKRNLSYLLMTVATIIIVIAVLNIPIINIIGIVVGCSMGFIGYKIHEKG